MMEIEMDMNTLGSAVRDVHCMASSFFHMIPV